MKISIFGLGYVGAVSMACLARDGHEVIGVDIDPDKLDLIRTGRSPIVEEGIQELMEGVVAAGRVSVTSDPAQAMRDSDLSFVCVGTPSSPNGSQDLGAIMRCAEQIGEALAAKPGFHVVVIRSTVRPGTVDGPIREALEKGSGKRSGEGFGLCFQPEFLREGTSIKDYDNPPYTVVGSDSPPALEALRALFGHLPCEFIGTDIGTAEMLKYACNGFHAVKVTFANEIGRIAQALGVDAHEVMRLVCEDRRLNISPAYLRPGFAFGGSCLPKDLKALLYLAKQTDIDVPMLSGLMPSNRIHVEHAIDLVLRRGARTVGLIGLSFKSGTDDLRESPLVTLAEHFIGKGLELKIYDPEVNLSRLRGANRRYIEGTIPHIASLMRASCAEVVHGSEIVIVGLNDKAIVERLPAMVEPDQFVLDLVNIPNREQLRGEYQGICW